jgi:hypothetical protein
MSAIGSSSHVIFCINRNEKTVNESFLFASTDGVRVDNRALNHRIFFRKWNSGECVAITGGKASNNNKWAK